MPQAHSYALNVETIPGTTTPRLLPFRQLSSESDDTKQHIIIPEIRIEPPHPSRPNEVLGGSSTTLIAKSPPEKHEEEEEENSESLSFRVELEFDAFVLVCFIIAIVVPLSMIIVGGVYILSCPAETMIPIFLVVSGSALIVSAFGLRKLAERPNQQLNTSCNNTLLRTAIFIQVAWFVAGCVWVYRTYEPDYITETSPSYCNQTLYQYSFWLLNSFFISSIVAVLLFCAYVCFGHHKAADSATPTKV